MSENKKLSTASLPQIAPFEVVIERAYRSDRENVKMLQVVGALPQEVERTTADGKVISFSQSWTLTCFEHEAPEAFKVLRDASKGDRLRVAGHLRAEFGKSGKGDYPRNYGLIEVTDAKLTGRTVMVDVDSSNVIG